jgi:NAD(P)-dependent dehydrogenase (short-subunit alcohol dehydrogenase family)
VQRLQGRRILITGASSGIGLAAARLFAEEGARLALLARSSEGLERARADVEAVGGRAHLLAVDIADRDAVVEAVEEAARVLGGLDVVVSNAATTVFGPFEAIGPEDFDRTFAVTFTGAVDLIRAALPHLERSAGVVVANVSVAGRIPLPLQSPYAAGKHALRIFLATLRVELRAARSPVRVCMVHPSPIGTPLWQHATSATGTQPRPARPVYRPQVAAQVLVEAAVRPRAEITVGGSGAALALLETVARPLCDLVLSSYALRDSRRSREPAPVPGALWRPAGAGRVEGREPGRRSVWTALRMRSRRVWGAGQARHPRS